MVHPIAESHTQEEREAKEVMDNLHKKFSQTTRNPISSSALSRFPHPSDSQPPPAADLPSFQVVGISSVRVRPQSASILKLSATKSREKDGEKKVAFSHEDPGNGPQQTPRSPVAAPEPKWTQVRVRSVELDAQESLPTKPSLPPSSSSSVKTMKKKMTISHRIRLGASKDSIGSAL